MTHHFFRQLIIHTICNVTGALPEEVTAVDRVELNTRDWEQVFSRLEATLDIQIGLMTSAKRSFSVGALTCDLYTKLADEMIS